MSTPKPPQERICIGGVDGSPSCGHGYEYSHLYADRSNPCSKILRVREVSEAQRAALHQEFRDEAGVDRCLHCCTFAQEPTPQRRELGGSSAGYMCADCGVDLDDEPEPPDFPALSRLDVMLRTWVPAEKQNPIREAINAALAQSRADAIAKVKAVDPYLRSTSPRVGNGYVTGNRNGDEVKAEILALLKGE